MSQLKVRSVDEGELDSVEEVLGPLEGADEALLNLVKLGGVEEGSLALGDGWAAAADIDGATLVVRGEPAGAGARWTISGRPGGEAPLHAARRLHAMVCPERPRDA